MRTAIEEHEQAEHESPAADSLLKSVYYLAGDTAKPETFIDLQRRLDALDKDLGLGGNRAYYLAVAPDLTPMIVKNLAARGMLTQREGSWIRVVFEKPFGRDLESARKLNEEIRQVLSEEQIYRIDHYLGKETVQNILSFRFGNSIFEPLFNRTHVNSIRITVAESGSEPHSAVAVFNCHGTACLIPRGIHSG